MKKFIPLLAFPFVMVACTSQPETTTRTLQSAQPAVAPTDTAGLAAFQQWKAQNELGTPAPVQQQVVPVEEPAPVRTVTVIREVRVPQQAAPARKPSATVKQQPAPAQPQPRPTPPVETPAPTPPASGSGDVASNGDGAGSGNTSAEAPAPGTETAKKEGTSNATKGAVLGGAGGAVVGAVISKKNKAAGAVIGGIIGGAAGYGIGKSKDKKEARQ
jgi:hypothetical protein